MPNWTRNTVAFIAKSDTLDNLVRPMINTQKNIVDFETLIPTPPELAQSNAPLIVDSQLTTDVKHKNILDPTSEIIAISPAEAQRRKQKYHALEWYEFRNRHWGTKWIGSQLEIMEDTPERIVVSFETAWSEPTGIFEHLHAHNIDIIGGCIYEDGDTFKMLTKYSQDENNLSFADLFGVETWVSRYINYLGVPQKA